jgi:hypothetical protein
MRYTLLAAAAAACPGAAFAATCFGYSLSLSDLSAIRDDVANNVQGWGWPIEAVAGKEYVFNHSSVQFCLNNAYLFDNTHIA